MPRTCVVGLLGGFRVAVDGRPVRDDAWRHRRAADLVKILALAPGHRLHREELMNLLWPDLEPEAAGANLRKALHFARRGLGGMDSIDAEGAMVVLWPVGDIRVDALEAAAAAAQALRSGAGLDAALALFTGDLLPEDRFAPWSDADRERLRNRRLELLRATGKWQQVLEVDPTDEVACRALMESHLQQGRRDAAIRQFQRLRDILRVDLGVAPEQSTVALFERAIAVEGAEPPNLAERAQALLARGLVHWNEGQLDAAEQVAEEAHALASGGQLARELGEACALLGMVALARGRWPQRFRQDFAEAVSLGVEQAPFVLDGHLCMAEASLSGADSESIARLARDLLPVALEGHSQPGEALISLLIGESLLFGGSLDEAREWLSRAEGLYVDLHWGSGHALSLLRLAEVDLAEGARGPATRHLSTARPLAERSELSSHLLVRVLAAMVQTADGPEPRRRVLAEAEEVLRQRAMCGPCSIDFRVAAAVACARSGDLDRAHAWLAGAERLAGMWQGGAWQASVWEARAAVRLAEGDRTQGAALMREAASLFAQCGRPLDEARCVAAVSAAN